MKRFLFSAIICCLVLASAQVYSLTGPDDANYYAAWKNGPPIDDSFFPIAVWLQNPADAEAYKEIGVNVYFGLWKGPTEDQLAKLKDAGMLTICPQNEVGLKHIDDPLIIGWMHGDEPDNAQRPIIDGNYSPPVLPKKIIGDYEELKSNDPSRPVFLNLGQGVAWNNYIGRGVRRNYPEDYREYARGSDIVSFDIYPVTNRAPQINGNLWYVARGVERLRAWTNNMKPVWNCIETTKIRAPRRATPHELRSEVWMSIVSGSGGITYFVHEWKPETDTRRLLNDPEMREAVKTVNSEIHALAPVINSPTVLFAAEVTASQPEVPVKTMVKRYKGETYLFACSMRGMATDADFFISGVNDMDTVELIGEDRRIELERGSFKDSFEPYGVHLYRFIKK